MITINVFSKTINRVRNFITPNNISTTDRELLEWLGIDSVPKNIVNETTYFTCLKVLSETLGKMPLKFYQETERGIIKVKSNKAHTLLKTRPNALMTPSTFWSTIEQNRNHYGNAYVWIRKKFKRANYGGSYEIQDFWIMPSDDVSVIIDDAGYFGSKGRIWYKYTDKHTRQVYLFNSDEILHFKTSHSFDGVLGTPVREILATTLEGGLESQEFLNNMYKNGLSAKAILEYTGDLNEEAKTRLVKGIENFANGSKNVGRIIPVPLGMKLVPLDIKLTDSQFYDLKKYNALQIASAFGIKPYHLNDYEKSSYANSETQQLSFYVDTVLFILKQYEEEINYKTLTNEEVNNGYHFKFNEKVLLRTDSKTQMEILATGVNNGLIKPDEGREQLGYPAEEGGDKLYMNGNYIPLIYTGQNYGIDVATNNANNENQE